MRDPGAPADDGDRSRSGGSLRVPDRPSDSRRDPRPNHEGRSRHRHSHHESSNHDRRRSPDRGRDRHGRSPSESSRRKPPLVDDLIPRYRASKEREREVRNEEKRYSRSSGRDREISPSGSASKRQRSRSRSRSDEYSHRKRSKRDRSTSRRRRDYDDDQETRKRRRQSPHESRKSSPGSRSRRSRSREKEEKPRSSRQSRPRSRGPGDDELKRSTREHRHYKSSRHRYESRTHSPTSTRSRSPVRSRARSQERHGTSTSTTPRVELKDQGYDERAAPPLSPARRQRRRDEADERYSSRRPEMNDDIPARGDYRGDYPQPYPHRPYHDDGYRGTPPPAGPYHDPPSDISYDSGRAWPSHRFSPHGHYPPNDRGYQHPGSSAPHYSSDLPAPSPGPSYSSGGFRGGARGQGFRGSFVGRPEAGEPSNGMPRSGANAVGLQERDGDDWHTNRSVGDAPSEPNQPTSDGRSMAPPNRQPPTGPAAHNNSSSKFSFAFKASAKPTAAAPKPEISQKFNATPKSRSESHDREPPKSAPTEPASARAWNESRVPDGPRMAPRMRKVKKIMKRPKPRPTLPSDLVASESVFYRKPGNESVVGSGTYGKVFKGLNVYTKGLVALKRIRMEGERDGFPVTAVREIKLLQSLRHPNIVNLQEVMVEKNDCFMVFEYLSHDLTGLLNHPSFKLEPAQKKHLAKQMFEGLEYLHTRGVLHRDIKAANILVSSDGILKIADFGLARFYAKHHQLDYTNRVITIWYRSPELLLGETKYTAAVDVWSAACVMVEIFTRGAIFPGDGSELNQLEKIYNILGTPNRRDWPGLVDMAWFELLRPSVKRKSVFAEKYADKVTPAAFDLLEAMFLFDPAKRPTAAQVLQHAYFTVEEPLPKQAIELASIDGEWHEFESKALRKANERKAREARRVEAAGAATSSKDKDRKRGHELKESGGQRDAKRTDLEGQESMPAAVASASEATREEQSKAAGAG